MKFKLPTRTLILTASLAAAMAVSAYAYDVQGGTVITSSAVNFREEATIESESMGKLADGTRVAILDETDGWYKVAYDGDVGYMSADYIETQPIMNIECGGAKVTTSVLNMRSGPSTENEIVTKLSEGTVAKIIGINNAWFKVQYDGNTGYISPDYVEPLPVISQPLLPQHLLLTTLLRLQVAHGSRLLIMPLLSWVANMFMAVTPPVVLTVPATLSMCSITLV